jgi:hypothetical protein
VTEARPARLPVWLIPAIMLLFVPAVATSWAYFYKKQRRELAQASSPSTTA